jgi:mono/diheme cytochrome c family protein
MRHVVVRRLTVVVAIAFLLSAVAFAWLVRDEPAAASTAQQPLEASAILFGRYCAACHAADDLRLQLRTGDSDTLGPVETFLRGHGDATDAEDRLIVDYLIVQP